MNHEKELSHRQEREHNKEEHAKPTPGRYLSSKHLGWGLAIGIVLIGLAVLIWTFILLPMRAHA